jgi:hypothetical protein
LLVLTVTVAACVNEARMRKRDAAKFLQTSTGEYVNEARRAAVHRAGVRAQ